MVPAAVGQVRFQESHAGSSQLSARISYSTSFQGCWSFFQQEATLAVEAQRAIVHIVLDRCSIVMLCPGRFSDLSCPSPELPMSEKEISMNSATNNIFFIITFVSVSTN
jgi:hypothetical protein